MSLSHVILGLLNREPMTGYDVKKIIENTPFMYWSGNNNQIYKALVELLGEGFVTKAVRHQDGSPSKNIYTITDDGLREFNDWLLSATELPVYRKQFLLKLALADQANRGDLEGMLASYADALRMQAVISEKELDKCYFAGRAPGDESRFLGLIRESVVSFYAGELAWIQKVKEFVAALPDESSATTKAIAQKERTEVKSTMSHRLIESQGKRYLYLTSSSPLVHREQDAMDILSLCGEYDTDAVILDGEVLSDDFVNLRTGVAGAVLQKFVNYRIKVAIVIKDGQSFPERFRGMLSEFRTSNTFRLFTNLEDATRWLLT